MAEVENLNSDEVVNHARENNQRVLGIGAVLALGVSIPLEWFTIHDAKVTLSGGDFDLTSRLASALGTQTFTVTGINGYVTAIGKLPIWFVVVIGLVGVLLALSNALRFTSLAKFVPLTFIFVSSIYVALVFGTATFSQQATLGPGIFVALAGLIMALGFAFRSPTAQ